MLRKEEEFSKLMSNYIAALTKAFRHVHRYRMDCLARRLNRHSAIEIPKSKILREHFRTNVTSSKDQIDVLNSVSFKRCMFDARSLLLKAN
jgi:hypothetical protein